jgi:Predicted Zn-dependent protease (DUF2268)
MENGHRNNMGAGSGGAGMRPVTSHVANSAGRLDRHLGLIGAAFGSSARTARDLLGADGIDMLFIDAPDEVIPEWGIGGSTYGPHVIIVAIDPGFPGISEEHLVSTLVHEFHHAMRWRGPGCGGDLGDMLVSEGLAQLFEEEVLGAPPMYSQVRITEAEVGQANLDLHRQPFSQAKWFFGAEGITRMFGYAYGYRICRAYAGGAAKRASELVNVPAPAVLRAAGLG